MDLTTVIETRPGVRRGKPCFIGTRIAVDGVLDSLASGMTTGEIVADFPELAPPARPGCDRLQHRVSPVLIGLPRT